MDCLMNFSWNHHGCPGIRWTELGYPLSMAVNIVVLGLFKSIHQPFKLSFPIITVFIASRNQISRGQDSRSQMSGGQLGWIRCHIPGFWWPVMDRQAWTVYNRNNMIKLAWAEFWKDDKSSVCFIIPHYNATFARKWWITTVLTDKV